MKTDDTSYFLIVGVGRSGTSLLQSILATHTEISIPPETGFVRHNLLTLTNDKGITLEEIISENPRVKRVLSSLSAEIPKSFNNLLEFYQFLLQAYKKEHNKLKVGDKDPRLVEYIDAVQSIFPKAKFIHLVRDPRDVLLSKKKAQWSQNKPSWYHIFANYVQLRLGEFSGRRLSKDQYLVISYENLLKSPQSTLKELCEYLSVDFESSMLSFQEKAKELVAEDEKQWKKETMGPLLKDNTGKWKGKLKDWEVILTEKLCKDAFRIGGYSKSDAFEKMSWFQKIGIYIIALIFRSLGSFYMFYRIVYQNFLIRWKF